MITLNFYTLAEKTPKHNESIIYLDKKYSFDSYGFQPREINVEYSWELVESDGTHCGVSVGHDENDPTPPELSEEEIADGCRYELVILAEDQYMNEDSLWSPAEEFWESFTGEKSYDPCEVYNEICNDITRQIVNQKSYY